MVRILMEGFSFCRARLRSSKPSSFLRSSKWGGVGRIMIPSVQNQREEINFAQEG
jgi:hypothetical protein